MEDQLISFETAKLAKKKGFKQIEKCCYDPLCLDVNHIYDWWREKECSTEERMKRLIAAPTQSLFQKWLREKHNIHIEISFDQDICKFLYKITSIICKSPYCTGGNYDSFEEALEISLQESLKTIKI